MRGKRGLCKTRGIKNKDLNYRAGKKKNFGINVEILKRLKDFTEDREEKSRAKRHREWTPQNF